MPFYFGRAISRRVRLGFFKHPFFKTFEKAHPYASEYNIFLFNLFDFQTALFSYILFCADMTESKIKFIKAAHVVRKGKSVIGVTGPKLVGRVKKIIIFPPLILPTTKEMTPIRSETFARDTSAAVRMTVQRTPKNADAFAIVFHSIAEIDLAFEISSFGLDVGLVK